MATITPMECGVCNEYFDEVERCPRILLCSHTLCTQCINHLIGNDARRCPFCRAAIDGSSSTDFMVNRALLDMINFMSAQICVPKTSFQKETSPCVVKVNDFRKEITATAKKHLASYKNLLEMSESSMNIKEELKSKLHQQCEIIENNVIAKFKEMIQNNRRCIDDLNTKQNDQSVPMEEIKNKQMLIEDLIERFDRVVTLEEASSLINETEHINKTSSEWIETYSTLLNNDGKNLQAITKDINSRERIVRYVLAVFEDKQEEEEEEEEEEGESCEEYLDLTSSILLRPLNRHITSFQELFITQGRVFAVQKQNGITRSARITFGGDKLFLHHLKEGPPPENAFAIEHDAVLSLIDYSSSLAFLELGACGSTLGRLLIRLYPDTKGARNFSLLCTGERGPSYASTNMLKMGNKGSTKEFVQGGDYEFNNGSGGKPLVPGLVTDLRESTYVRPWKAGIVWGNDVGANVHYCININDIYSGKCYHSFGFVQEGLNILREAVIHYQNISQIKVQDCGVVLSYSSF